MKLLPVLAATTVLALAGCGGGGMSEGEAYAQVADVYPQIDQAEFRDLATGYCEDLDETVAAYAFTLAMDDGKRLADEVAVRRAMTEFQCPGKTGDVEAAAEQVAELTGEPASFPDAVPLEDAYAEARENGFEGDEAAYAEAARTYCDALEEHGAREFAETMAGEVMTSDLTEAQKLEKILILGGMVGHACPEFTAQ